MEDFRTEEGVTLDLCARCRSVWFDAGEMAATLGTTEDLPALADTDTDSVASELPCPRCPGATLTVIPYARGVSVTVATCALCGGALSSLPELPALRGAAMAFRPSRTLARVGGAGDLALTARRFAGITGLTVKQRRRWLEMLTGWETPNEYAVLRSTGGVAFHIVEQTDGFWHALRRVLLGPWRPFEAHVEDMARGTLAMRLVRPWRWFFPELTLCDPEGRPLVIIRNRWSWIHRRYEITDAAGRVLGDVTGKLYRPWTFEIRSEERVVAMVRKVWSGLLTEAFSDADNYTVSFEPGAPEHWKPIALAVAVLIDTVHFESANR